MLQTFNVPAGGRIVNAKASFFRYESASAAGADESVRVRADGNDLGTYLPGDSIKLPINAASWEITPVTGAATCIVRLGIGGIESSRIFGNVRIIDSSVDKSLAGRQFIVGITAAAVVGRNSHAGYKNKATANKAVIKRIQIGSAIAAQLSLTFADNISGTDYVEAVLPVNKSYAGNPSVGRGITFSDLSTFTATRTFMQFAAPAGGLIEAPITTPLILLPTTCLYVQTNAVNSATYMIIDFEEID